MARRAAAGLEVADDGGDNDDGGRGEAASGGRGGGVAMPAALAQLERAREELRSGLARREAERAMLMRALTGGGRADEEADMFEEMQMAMGECFIKVLGGVPFRLSETPMWINKCG